MLAVYTTYCLLFVFVSVLSVCYSFILYFGSVPVHCIDPSQKWMGTYRGYEGAPAHIKVSSLFRMIVACLLLIYLLQMLRKMSPLILF